MSVTRSRSFDNRGLMIGTYQTFDPFPSETVQSATFGAYGTCDDSVAGRTEKRVPHALLIVKKLTSLPTFSGRFPLEGDPIKQLTNCPSDYHPAEPSPGVKFAPLSTLEQSNLAWSSLAATNPNVAHVSVPTFVAELKDLPSLWRFNGQKQFDRAADLWRKAREDMLGDRAVRQLLEKANGDWAKGAVQYGLTYFASAELWWRWGVKPLLNDIRSLFEFTAAAEQRFQMLKQFQDGERVIKRKATLRTNTEIDPPTSVGLKSVGAFIPGLRTVRYTERVWCSVQWTLDSSVVLPEKSFGLDPLRVKAYQLTFGLTTQDALSALWEILPWSWYVDWFLHIQTVLDATNNHIPMTWGDICLMRSLNATAITIPDASSSDLAWCVPTGTHMQSEDRKQRLIISPVLPFAPSFMPVFTTGQWSILGSLAVLKAVAGSL